MAGIKIYILTLSFFFSAMLYAQTSMVQGFVFEDKNGNRIKDNGEAGIADVMVSNQQEVVITDKFGKYSLPAYEEMIVFITKPSGYRIPVNEKNLPQFFYIHQPNGSPSGLKYEGIKPTGALPASVDFALYSSDEDLNFSAIISGDPQPRDSMEVGYFRDDIVATMMEYPAEFYLALGDIAFDNLNIYGMYNQVVSKLGIPAYNVHGNHDMNYLADSDRYAAETFKRIFGPPDYSFNYGRVHFIILDDVEYKGWNPEKNRSGGYRGFLNERQLQWLKNDLAWIPDDYLIAISTHIPIVTSESDGESVNVVNRDRLFEILKNRKHLLSLSAHMHFIEHRQFSQQDGWLGANSFYSINAGASCGAWWSGPKDERGIPESFCLDGSPNGFYIINFEGHNYNYRFIPAKVRESTQMRLTFPTGTISRKVLTGKEILVNIFNADPAANVSYRIDESVSKSMEQKTMQDPFVTEYLENRPAFPDWINEAVTHTHMWKAQLPADLLPGAHKLTVTARDSRNNILTGTWIFNIE